MLNALIRWALLHRLAVVASACLLLVYGVLTLQKLPIDIFPDITKPTVVVMTEAHGMAPEEVETRVTLPLESFLTGMPGMDRIRSQSGIGLSVIYLEFKWDTDIYRLRQIVQERLTLAEERMPPDITPTMAPIGSLLGQIQQIAVTSKDQKISPLQLRDIAEWNLRPRLMTIPGVSNVISIGGGLKQYQIQVSAEKLNRYQLSMDAVDGQLTRISQNTTGGFLESDGKEKLVRNIGVVESVEDIRKTFVGLHFGRPVLVGDIAEVHEAPRLKRGDGSFNGGPAVIMTVLKQPGADTVTITRAIEKAVEELRPSLPTELIINTDVFKQAHFIEASINGIQGKLKLGTILVFVVLFIFLANMRMSVITLTAIPVSFICAFIVFKIFGLTVNTMTLGGLAIAIGELVDDSIVDVENVFRRLRENAKAAMPQPLLKVIYEASSEIRNSIVLATVIIALVFIPLFTLDGLEGRLFAPLGIAYLTALGASLLVSLTLTPVLCSFLLKGSLKEHHDTWLVTKLKNWDRKILEWSLPRSSVTLGAAVVVLVGALSLVPFMGKDFLPHFNEGTAMVALSAPPGVNLTESNERGLLAEQIMLSIPEVKSVSRRTGRAEMDEHAMGVNVSEIDVDFHPTGRPRDVVLNNIRDEIKKQIPDVSVNVGQPISHLIDHMLSGVNAAVAVKVFGPDLATLQEKSFEIEEAIEKIPGLVDLRVEQQGLIPQVKIFVMREDAAKFGLSPGDITELLETALNGKTVTHILEETRSYEVFLQYDQRSRADLDALKRTILKIMPDGRRVTLNEVADVYEASGPNEINREDNQRRMIISANVSKRDLAGVVEEIRSVIEESVQLPQGYFIVYDGQFKSQKSATRTLLLYSMISILGIVLVLYSHFRSKMMTAQILATIPLAFIGGLILLFFTDRTLTVASLVGFITLCGVTARNSIMMISHYLHLMKFEGESFSKEMIIRGSQERLVPVLMTALVTSLALLPLVLAKGEPGSEILHPVAVVVVGGLISSSLLDIVVTPALFYRFGKKASEKYVSHVEKDVL
ncbi:multidrug transporter AcrB [Bdellovibrio bacteriovorus]|uniref:Multidrug transporter AcrB n=1 Tax=Bdellovibrio bacteriovorus TaxID=959 RepID=A0A150WEX5_BDEBC|nr:efflux RND transporter permease subunit [Bdellovibrio bacteriovorus]KYG61401.1 multidrug transporter AcrB [Bdellovibrio bacteriovorus]